MPRILTFVWNVVNEEKNACLTLTRKNLRFREKKETFAKDFIKKKIDIKNASDNKLKRAMNRYEKIDDSKDYSLEMPMKTLAKKVEELRKKSEGKRKKKLFEMKNKNSKTLWLGNLENSEKFVNKNFEKKKR